jgi:colanic acid/amylovoran biosynthesis protein
VEILIINQPIQNRGDESAHRSLVRALVEAYPVAHISCVFVGEKMESIRQIQVKSPSVDYIAIPLSRGATRIPALTLKFRVRWLVVCLHPAYRRLKKYMDSADYIVNAPGGICMGGFQSWQHIFYLLMAKDSGKPIAYYSRSFGPFSDSTRSAKRFKQYSLDLLNYFNFLSVRDSKTMEIANQMELRYIRAIDTAFLNVPIAKVPVEVTGAIGSSDYIVFVPNALVWHVDYRAADAGMIDDFFLALIDMLKLKYPSSKVVMLPQLYNAGHRGDNRYFETLRHRSSCSDQLVVLPDSYGSDVQQAIIAKAKLVVGARYHSIVFAINNRVPFVALSYEHKISGLLASLNLGSRGLEIGRLGKSGFDERDALNHFAEMLNQPCPLDQATKQAHALARGCFEGFVEHVNDRKHEMSDVL